MKGLWVFFSIAAVLSFISCTSGQPKVDPEVVPEYVGTVNTYPWPEGMTKHTGVSLRADGKNIDLYSVRANNRYRWDTNAENYCDQLPVGMFDMEGTVYISITVPAKPENVIIRPLSGNITPTLYPNKITFSINEPGQYAVEYNNNIRNAVLIFANPIEDFTEIENDSATTVIEPGIQTMDGKLDVWGGQTLYLKPGAVIRGAVAMNGRQSKIVGRGIIDGSHLRDWVKLNFNATIPIETYRGDTLEISGITIFDPNGWAVQLQNSSDITMDNVKIVSSRCNSDGISIQSSNNITIQNCFLRTWDDSVVIKNYGSHPNDDSYDITVKNCVFWTDLAQTMEIGVETNKADKPDPKIYNIKFEDILIFHAMHKAPISIHNGDNAEIYNVSYKNIIIEDYQAGNGDGWNYLIDITNLTGQAMGGAREWTHVQERGTIHDVLVENVRIVSGKAPSARFNSSQGGRIYNVTVRDIYRDENKVDLSDKVAANSNTTVTFP